MMLCRFIRYICGSREYILHSQQNALKQALRILLVCGIFALRLVCGVSFAAPLK